MFRPTSIFFGCSKTKNKKKTTKFCVPRVLSLIFLMRKRRKLRSYSSKYASQALAYCSARSNGRIMVDISIDCTESHEKHEGSMNEIGREIKAGGWI